jgi:hypothetical protein
MHVGLHVASFMWNDGPGAIRATLTDLAQAAEEAGCQHVSVMDHYLQIDSMFPVTDTMLEAYTTLGFLAARTERLKLHVLATGVTYRHPGLLAKIVSTLDVLSGGRAELAKLPKRSILSTRSLSAWMNLATQPSVSGSSCWAWGAIPRWSTSAWWWPARKHGPAS